MFEFVCLITLKFCIVLERISGLNARYVKITIEYIFDFYLHLYLNSYEFIIFSIENLNIEKC